MSNTAWFDETKLPNAMLNSGFKPLNQSDHFESLNESLSKAEGVSLLDSLASTLTLTHMILLEITI